MDYTIRGPWHDDAAPDILAADLDAMEAGIQDASTHHKRGTLAAMPAAGPANKNWIYWAYDTGERFMSNGVAWQALPVGTNALIDSSVTTAKVADTAITSGKLAAAVSARLAANSDQVGALAGLAGFNGQPAATRSTPSDSLRYMLASNIAGRFTDLSAAGNFLWFEQGLWLVQSVFGFSASDNTPRASLVYASLSTGGEGIKFVTVMATAGNTTNVTVSHVAENNGSGVGGLRVTASLGNTRTFFTRLQPGATP